MEKFKMNLDRESLSSEKIQRYKDFNQLKSDVMLLKKPLWKSPWFWGTTGIASTAIILSINVVATNKLDKHEAIITNQEHSNSHAHDKNTPASAVQANYSVDFENESPVMATKLDVNIGDVKKEPRATIPSKEKDETTEKQIRTLSFDLLEDEFPALKDVKGERFEILDRQRFNPQWFDHTWDDVLLRKIDDVHYLLKFSSNNVTNELKIKRLASK